MKQVSGMSDTEWFTGEPDPAAWDHEVWQRLVESTGNRQSGWRLPVLGTVSNGEPRQRIVVLRQVDAVARTLLVHTDIRSAKIDEISTQPKGSWLFYDATNQVQLQLTGVVQIHSDDDVADSLWASETDASLRGYLGPLAPGTPCPQPEVNLPQDVRHRIPSRDELAEARCNFAVLSCQIQSAELVVLRQSGNLRARFGYSGEEADAHWVAP